MDLSGPSIDVKLKEKKERRQREAGYLLYSPVLTLPDSSRGIRSTVRVFWDTFWDPLDICPDL